MGREKTLERKETMVVGPVMVEYPLVTLRSRNQWGKDTILSLFGQAAATTVVVRLTALGINSLDYVLDKYSFSLLCYDYP